MEGLIHNRGSVLIPINILGTERRLFRMFSFTDDRENISKLCKKNYFGVISREQFIDQMRAFGINSIKSGSDFPAGGIFPYDCMDWAFDTLGLSHYREKDSGYRIVDLLHKDFPDLFSISGPRDGALALYYNNLGHPVHFGLVDHVDEDIIVRSKWGGLDLFEHSLEKVDLDYGDNVMFFEKR